MKLTLTAPKGKMGMLITAAAASRPNLHLAYGLAPQGRDYLGLDLGQVTGLGRNLNAPVISDVEEAVQNSDLILDYSTTECSLAVLAAARKYKKAVVCGTTGFSAEEFKLFKEASMEIPVLYAANTSRVVNLMYKLLELAAATLGESADIEIIEMHDRQKLDAPSGTSKEMGHAIASALGKNLDDLATFGRHGRCPREEGTIGYHSIRSGDISSSHTVLFGLMGERLEITHHAHNWKCFAEGAVESAEFLRDKGPGFYTVKDVLGL